MRASWACRLAVGMVGLAVWAAPAAAQEDFPPKASKEHKALAADVGTWDATVKAWMDPSADPVESKGSETNTAVLGGLFLQSEFKGDFAGMPFEGRGLTGYDTNKKKFVGTWVDNFSTGIMVMEGTYDEATKTLTSTGESFDPQQGKMVKFKMVSKHNDDGTRQMTMYMLPDGSGEGVKMMEITYKKRK